MVRWFLFETWFGDRLLALFERVAGLAVVEVASLEPRENPSITRKQSTQIERRGVR